MTKGEETRNRIMQAIKQYFNEHGYAPSYEEIGDMAGIKSKSTVKHNLDVLFDEGKLQTDHYGSPRALRVVE